MPCFCLLLIENKELKKKLKKKHAVSWVYISVPTSYRACRARNTTDHIIDDNITKMTTRALRRGQSLTSDTISTEHYDS